SQLRHSYLVQFFSCQIGSIRTHSRNWPLRNSGASWARTGPAPGPELGSFARIGPARGSGLGFVRAVFLERHPVKVHRGLVPWSSCNHGVRLTVRRGRTGLAAPVPGIASKCSTENARGKARASCINLPERFAGCVQGERAGRRSAGTPRVGAFRITPLPRKPTPGSLFFSRVARLA